MAPSSPPPEPLAPIAPAAGDEFEREPVPPSHHKKTSSFVAMFAGEHVAGTEFMIGPLFVAHGSSAVDVIVGLLLGNLLAVLSWRYLCAPIATRLRMTLYFKLEKICGANLVKIYNLANGVMFCFLAGAMISVSATAVGVPIGMEMPGFDDWLPNSVGWVVAVLAVGAVISVVAARGYDAVARFSALSAPWMVLVFAACGVAALPQLGIESPGEFWSVAKQRIWTGRALPGQQQFTFWHLVSFGWFANMAMHVGMADLSIFRYAKKASAGWASAVGMFVGHYMAWIAASLLYAVQLHADPGNTTVAPGPMAYGVAGWAGVVCVVVAGWTTANPTIYRSGLAFQILFPRWSRTRVTILAGVVSTVAAIFPALVMKLLDFVALYGLLLMPMGTVIFVDFWLSKRLGFQPDYAAASGSSFNWAPGLAWFLTVGVCAFAVQVLGMDKFFMAAPAWLFAAIVYIVASRTLQKRSA